jgi:hypothetical protein
MKDLAEEKPGDASEGSVVNGSPRAGEAGPWACTTSGEVSHKRTTSFHRTLPGRQPTVRDIRRNLLIPF